MKIAGGWGVMFVSVVPVRARPCPSRGAPPPLSPELIFLVNCGWEGARRLAVERITATACRRMPTSSDRVRLTLPEELLPKAEDALYELRLKAVAAVREKHKVTSGPLQHLALELSAAELTRWGRNEIRGVMDMSPELKLTQHLLLVLVGKTKLLTSVAEKGEFTGENVLDELASAWETLVRVNLEQMRSRGNVGKTATEREALLEEALESLRDGRSGRVQGPMTLAHYLGGFLRILALGFLMYSLFKFGYWQMFGKQFWDPDVAPPEPTGPLKGTWSPGGQPYGDQPSFLQRRPTARARPAAEFDQNSDWRTGTTADEGWDDEDFTF